MRDFFRTILYFTALSLLLFLCHTAFFSVFTDAGYTYFRFRLPELYGFFYVCSVGVFATVHRIDNRNRDIVGMSFLLVSSIKMAVAGVLAKIFLLKDGVLEGEKINFLILFILFLTMETILTIRILNKKQ